MPSLNELLSRDHDRLDALLAAAVRADGTIDEASYREFRAGLLWHIGVEERILFPLLRRHGGSSALMQHLHRDHAALAALLVPPPTAAEIGTIRAILEVHNPLEEGPSGFYDLIERIADDELPALMARVHELPPVRLAAHVDSEITRRSIEQLIREAEESRRTFAGSDDPRS